MRSEKGICLLLFICGHAFVGAELRGATAKMGDHDGAHSFPNTRELQTALCSANPACVALSGGESYVISGSMCCPTPYGTTLPCCAGPTTPDDNRDDGPTGGVPVIPIPVPIIPTPAPITPALPIPDLTPITPAKVPLCSAHPRCVALAGGAERLVPGSMCCPTPYNFFLSCCD